ncbi:MAG: 1-acyl-sn-glycerol-3-phosphate acyltransferase [Myxococcota bacterium]
MPWLYRGLRSVFKRGARFYFLEIETAGEANLPEGGSTIFASNHPGSIMDVVVLGTVVPRTIHYLARSGLFRALPARWLLLGAGAIPVSRSGGANEQAFAAAHAVLRDGEAIGIFPEGRNAPLRHVRDIKTGCARIALGAGGVTIVPVGINYEERDRFLSRVLVRFGEPISTERYEAQHKTDPRGAVRALTDDLQVAMREAAVHIDEEYADLAGAIDALVGEELEAELLPTVDIRSVDKRVLQRLSGRGSRDKNLDGRFRIRQWIADAVTHFADEDPESLNDLRTALEAYRWRLDRLRIGADFREGSKSARRQSLGLMAYAVLLAPIALYGLIHNFVPYRLTRRFALGAPDEAMIMIRAFGGGLAFFGLTYALFASLALGTADSWWSPLLYVLSLPITGVWFLRYRRRLQGMRKRILFTALFRRRKQRIAKLLADRNALLARIDRLRRRYETVRLEQRA